MPSIYAPLFILKKSFVLKNSVTKQIQNDPKIYKTTKPVVFRAPDYFFRRNKNLTVMNFRVEDMISLDEDQEFN